MLRLKSMARCENGVYIYKFILALSQAHYGGYQRLPNRATTSLSCFRRVLRANQQGWRLRTTRIGRRL